MLKPYVLCSVAVSLDACIDDASEKRLILSNPADLERVDELRASCDAILVGANTLRRDNPKLCIHSADLKGKRENEGKSRDPMKVTIVGEGDLDPSLNFFHAGECTKAVYCKESRSQHFSERLKGLADVRTCPGADVDLAYVLEDLSQLGVGRLMVEGGSRILASFLSQGLVDELRLAVAPFFVGDPKAPRFTVGGGCHPELELQCVERIGNMGILTFRRGTPCTCT